MSLLQAQSLSDVHLLLAFFSVTAAGVDIVMSSCVMLLKLLDACERLAAVRADVVFHLVVNYFDVCFKTTFASKLVWANGALMFFDVFVNPLCVRGKATTCAKR